MKLIKVALKELEDEQEYENEFINEAPNENIK
jgi:hypothetical protein